MPLSSEHKVDASDLALTPWLKDGTRYTPTLPDLAQRIADQLKGMPNGKVLDIGCGSGELLRLLMARGLKSEQLYGWDCESEHVRLAARRTGIPESHFTIGPFDYTKAENLGIQFKAVTAINWLHANWEGNDFQVTYLDYRELSRGFRAVVGLGGKLYWDWHDHNGLNFTIFYDSLSDDGLCVMDAMEFDRTDKQRYPEAYPIYVSA